MADSRGVEELEVMKAKLPFDRTKEGKERRREIFNEYDVNGNGYLSLAELDKMVKEVMRKTDEGEGDKEKEREMGRAVMRAYQAARAVDTEGNEDYVEFREFRLFLHYLRTYYEFRMMFNQLDGDRHAGGQDGRISRSEFVAAVPLLRKWGASVSEETASTIFEKEVDADGKGEVLFDEFARWCFEKQLNFDPSDDTPLPSAPRISLSHEILSRARGSKRGASGQDDGIGKTEEESEMADLSALPFDRTSESVAARKRLMYKWDVNGNGILSLAEIDKGLSEMPGLADLYSRKPVLLRAFTAAKSVGDAKDPNGIGADYIDARELRYFLQHLSLFYVFHRLFEKADGTEESDGRLSRDELTQCVPVLKELGIEEETA
eukprot:CAMPEP_0119124000 /NCGR_PEP_ID=MMETSP1310-20130426/3748_1 /TAXON_ID=464262 /ORGANISM="Genus nov. species nov., Strain RCC2339" /LENGTH=376 /DNA_ID=CAMNT_0007113883 /DNA_START=81 /DNA_END=1207 /DNA_ORIENTATION=-